MPGYDRCLTCQRHGLPGPFGGAAPRPARCARAGCRGGAPRAGGLCEAHARAMALGRLAEDAREARDMAGDASPELRAKLDELAAGLGEIAGAALRAGDALERSAP